MEVTRIAETQFNAEAVKDYMTWDGEDLWVAVEGAAEGLAEFAGRLCYESYDRPNPKTKTTDKYLKNITDHKHFSVFEHATVTYLVTTVSRTLTHEFIRHRHFNYSQLSQRYVDQSTKNFVMPEELKPYLDMKVAGYENVTVGHLWSLVTEMSKESYEMILETLEDTLPKKALRGAARGLLSQAVETTIVITGNHRGWREVIEKRNSEAADREIRDLAALVLADMKEKNPDFYQDFEG